VYRELRELLNTYPERSAVGEIFENRDLKSVASYLGNDQLHMAFNFDFTNQSWLPRAFQQSILAGDAATPPDAWPCYVLSNHDLPRHVTRHGGGPFAEARAKVAAALLLTLRGTPFLYYGEELAMPSPFISRSQTVDPPSQRYWPFYNRDSARTPMQWDDSVNSGFTTGEPWLPVGNSYTTCNVAAQSEKPDSVLNFYRDVIRLRKNSPALRRGNYQPLIDKPVAAMTYLREVPGQTMWVALNFFGHSVEVPTPPGQWALRLSSHPGEHTWDKTLTLQAFEACIFERVP
jgi:alpha-glucosidase